MSQNEIVSETNYYPFGLAHKGYNEHSKSSNLGENWKYQGQERTTDMNLNIDEWKYRVSDPALGRFWQIDPLAEDYVYNSTYAFQENKLGMGTELEGKELQLAPWLLKDAAKNSNGVGAHALGFGQGVVNSVEGTINALSDPVQTLSTMGELLSPGLAPNTTQIGLGMAVADGANKLVNGNGFERGEVIGGLATAVVGTKGTTAALKGASTALKGVGVTNSVPSTLAIVVPGNVKTTTLGVPSASDVFVTASKDISRLNATQIAKKLTIPQSSSGFNVIQFSTPKTGLASPINRTTPGFIGRGRTAGGAREFTVPNQQIPADAKIKKIN